MLPDWDMFQTAGGEAGAWGGFHAAARCVSGGPVYITDIPGSHDLDLIGQMTGRTPRGKTVVFRPSVVGRVVLGGYEGYDDVRAGRSGTLVKVGAYHGRAAEGTGIVGVFNLAEREVAEVLPLVGFPGVVTGEGRRYVVRAHGTGRVTPPVEVGSPASLLAVSLGLRGYDVLCAYPLKAVESSTRGEVLLANLGLVGKLTGCAAVMRTLFEVRENGRMLVDATLKALGVLGKFDRLISTCCAD